MAFDSKIVLLTDIATSDLNECNDWTYHAKIVLKMLIGSNMYSVGRHEVIPL